MEFRNGLSFALLGLNPAERLGRQGDPGGSLALGLDSLRFPPGDPQISAKESLEGGVGGDPDKTFFVSSFVGTRYRLMCSVWNSHLSPSLRDPSLRYAKRKKSKHGT